MAAALARVSVRISSVAARSLHTTAGAAKKATLHIDGEEPVDLPVYSPSLGQDVIDVSSLTGKGYFTFDPGFMSTASCESKMTFIDGGKGVLVHSGYPIDQLANKYSFLDVSFLLWNNRLPNEAESKEYEASIKGDMAVPENIENLVRSFPQSAHPMGVLCSAVGGLSTFYHEGMDVSDPAYRLKAAKALIAKMPAIGAMTYKLNQGEDFIAPRDDLSYAANFLHMLHSTKDKDYEISPTIDRAFDKILTLHADHEQNASTSTVRLAGSSGANPFAAIAGGIAALWGPAHGGANEAVLKMLDQIGDESNIEKFVAKAKDKNDPFRLMGFGHRVYKNFDPRAIIMKETCDDVLAELGIGDHKLFKMASKLEKIAREDEYFVSKKLYPNVDFYSGIILKALGIPVPLFTVVFALGRSPGWISQWHELLSAPYKIGRPRQLYTGETIRDVPDRTW